MTSFVLIYGIGNSDLQIESHVDGGNSKPRSYPDSRFVAGRILDAWDVAAPNLMIDPETRVPCGVEFDAAIPVSDQRETPRGVVEARVTSMVWFPILSDVLAELAARHQGDWLDIQFLVTDQRPPHDGDTIGIYELFNRYIDLLRDSGAVHPSSKTSARRLTNNPSNYDVMTREYGQIAREIDHAVNYAQHAYCFITTGTPAMSFAAASVWSGDARISFIAKPAGSRAISPIAQIHQQERRTTVDLIGQAVGRGDFDLTFRLLTSPRSGFAPHDDRFRSAAAWLSGAAAWEREDYGAARSEGGDAISLMAEILSQRKSTNGSGRFWMAKLVDEIIRLRFDLLRHHLSEFIDRLIHVQEIAVLAGLELVSPRTTVNPGELVAYDGIDHRFASRMFGAKGREIAQAPQVAQYLLWSSTVHSVRQAARDWIDRVMSFRSLITPTLRNLRNAHTHNFAHIQAHFLDNFIAERSGIPVDPGVGSWVLLELAEQLADSWPGADVPNRQGFARELGEIGATLCDAAELDGDPRFELDRYAPLAYDGHSRIRLKNAVSRAQSNTRNAEIEACSGKIQAAHDLLREECMTLVNNPVTTEDDQRQFQAFHKQLGKYAPVHFSGFFSDLRLQSLEMPGVSIAELYPTVAIGFIAAQTNQEIDVDLLLKQFTRLPKKALGAANTSGDSPE